MSDMTPKGLHHTANYLGAFGHFAAKFIHAAADAWEAERRGEIYLGKPLAWWVECNNAAVQNGYETLIGEIVALRKRLAAAEKQFQHMKMWARGWTDPQQLRPELWRSSMMQMCDDGLAALAAPEVRSAK